MRLHAETQGVYPEREVPSYGLSIERMRIISLYGMTHDNVKWFRL